MTAPEPIRWARARAYEWDIDLPVRPVDRADSPRALDGTQPGTGPASGAGHPSQHTKEHHP